MNIDYLNKLLNMCWSYDTCSPGLKNIWSSDTPSLGQCAISSLIVNVFLVF